MPINNVNLQGLIHICVRGLIKQAKFHRKGRFASKLRTFLLKIIHSSKKNAHPMSWEYSSCSDSFLNTSVKVLVQFLVRANLFYHSLIFYH